MIGIGAALGLASRSGALSLLMRPEVLMLVLGLFLGAKGCDGWHDLKGARAERAALEEQLRIEAATRARNARTMEELERAVTEESVRREAAELKLEDFENALSGNDTDSTFRVGPDVGRLFDAEVGLDRAE